MGKIKSILAIFFSVLVLSTSMGAVVYQHYCGNMVKEVSLAKIEKHCQDHQGIPACHHPDEKKDCCKTEKKSLTTSEKQVKQAENFSIVKNGTQFVTVFYVLVQYLFTNPLSSTNQHTLSEVVIDSPPAEQSIFIAHQSFLI